MKRLSNICGLLVLMAALLVLSATSVFAAPGVDWDNAVITAQGTGVPPANAYNSVQARMMARRAAIVDAYRQLAEQIKGVNVDADTTVENMMVTSDVVKTHVSALVQGARITDEKVLPEGGYQVTMQVSVFGVSNSLASAVYDNSSRRVQESYPAPVSDVAPSVPMTLPAIENSGSTAPTYTTDEPIRDNTGTSAAATPSGRAIGNYTGLIVDCRGLGLTPVMSPVIENEVGTPIYGYKNLDYDKVVKDGMASYTRDIRTAGRAGSHPLVVKAVRLDHNANPVLSIADANRVLIENGATGFLDDTKVVFVR